MSDDVLVLDDAIVDAAFDEATHTWTVRTGDRTHRAGIVIAAGGSFPAVPAKDGVVLAPYLGVATHGVPNYFVVGGPEAPRQKRYVGECLDHMARRRCTRIEVRYSTQRVFNDRATQPNWRRMRDKIASAFDFASLAGADDGVYDGPAVVRVADADTVSRVRLAGRIEPIDGRYHWRGTVFGALAPATRFPQPVTLTIDGHTVAARLTERTQQGGYSVVGVGAPPFARTAMASKTTATTAPAAPDTTSGT